LPLDFHSPIQGWVSAPASTSVATSKAPARNPPVPSRVMVGYALDGALPSHGTLPGQSSEASKCRAPLGLASLAPITTANDALLSTRCNASASRLSLPPSTANRLRSVAKTRDSTAANAYFRVSQNHSRAIILSHGNALIFQCKFFLPTVKTRPSVRQNSSLLISKENSRDLSSARFRPLSPTIGRFFSNSRQPIETSRLKKDRHEVSTTRAHQRKAARAATIRR
jgi:hypothetical protein